MFDMSIKHRTEWFLVSIKPVNEALSCDQTLFQHVDEETINFISTTENLFATVSNLHLNNFSVKDRVYHDGQYWFAINQNLEPYREPGQAC